MAAKYSLVLFILSLTISMIACQTFQYSHGWTNGKRSGSSQLEEVLGTTNKNNGQFDNVLLYCELQKLRLLLQGNIHNQLLQTPCEFFGTPKRTFPEGVMNEQLRRDQPPNSNSY